MAAIDPFFPISLFMARRPAENIRVLHRRMDRKGPSPEARLTSGQEPKPPLLMEIGYPRSYPQPYPKIRKSHIHPLTSPAWLLGLFGSRMQNATENATVRFVVPLSSLLLLLCHSILMKKKKRKKKKRKSAGVRKFPVRAPHSTCHDPNPTSSHTHTCTCTRRQHPQIGLGQIADSSLPMISSPVTQ